MPLELHEESRSEKQQWQQGERRLMDLDGKKALNILIFPKAKPVDAA